MRDLPPRDVIDLLSDKWRVPVLHLLRTKSMRSNQLQRALAGISPKMLSQTLRGLERDGLVHRHVYDVLPAHVEYDLTPLGQSLMPILQDLCRWAKDNIKIRNDARRRFDQAQNSAKPRLRK